MLSFLYVYSDHSILECYNLFSGVELSMRSFFVIYKSPGNNGITKEFLKYFWGTLGTFLVSTPNHSFEKGELSTSQKQAIITLIEKKDKDKRFIKNWRPISLINVDIKVASKALANRLKTVIHNLISVDQTAYVKGRFIGESIRVINDLIEHIDREDEEGTISYFQQILRKLLIQ